MSAQLPSIYSLPEWYEATPGRAIDRVKSIPLETRMFSTTSSPSEFSWLTSGGFDTEMNRLTREFNQAYSDRAPYSRTQVENAFATQYAKDIQAGRVPVAYDKWYSVYVPYYDARQRVDKEQGLLQAYNKEVGSQPHNRAVPVTDEVPIEELLTQSMPSEAANLASLGLYSDDLESMVQARRK